MLQKIDTPVNTAAKGLLSAPNGGFREDYHCNDHIEATMPRADLVQDR